MRQKVETACVNAPLESHSLLREEITFQSISFSSAQGLTIDVLLGLIACGLDKRR